MRNSFWLGAAVTAAALCFGPATDVQATESSEQTAPATEQKKPTTVPYAEIYRVLNSLKHARYELQHAPHTFAGHRERALLLIDQSIEELQQALQISQK